MADQRGAWDSFYGNQSRPWRGVSKIDTGVTFPASGRILEVGCGNGKTVASLLEMGYAVTGVDFSEEAIRSCRDRFGEAAEFECVSADRLPFDDCEFDGVVMFHVLEHLEYHELLMAVSEACRVMKRGGTILVKVFSSDDMRSEKGERMDASTVVRGNGIRYHYFTESELRSLFWTGEIQRLVTRREATRFGEVRSRIELDFLKY